MRRFALLLGAIATLASSTPALAATHQFRMTGSGTSEAFSVVLAYQTVIGAGETETHTWGAAGNVASAVLDTDGGTLTLRQRRVITDGDMAVVSPNPSYQEILLVISGLYSNGVLSVSSVAWTETWCQMTSSICGHGPNVSIPAGAISFVGSDGEPDFGRVSFEVLEVALGQTLFHYELVPEPASLTLLGGSLAGLAFLRRRSA